MPDKAAAMLQTLKSWQVETGALLPSGPNPTYDPQAERPRGNQGGDDTGKGQPGKNKGQQKDAK